MTNVIVTFAVSSTKTYTISLEFINALSYLFQRRLDVGRGVWHRSKKAEVSRIVVADPSAEFVALSGDFDTLPCVHDRYAGDADRKDGCSDLMSAHKVSARFNIPCRGGPAGESTWFLKRFIGSAPIRSSGANNDLRPQIRPPARNGGVHRCVHGYRWTFLST